MTNSKGAALAIMAQAPVPGNVKTRLQPHLTTQESADFYTALLLDTLEMASSIRTCVRFLVFSPPEKRDLFAKIAPPGFRLLPQSSGDLGTRMLAIFLQLGESGYSPVVVIGTDIPTLQPQHIAMAFDCLHASDLCLGPSTDGGYYLIGASQAHPSLFDGVAWGTSSVLQDTLERARASDLSLALLEPLTDVDTIDDLVWLREEMQRLSQVSGPRIASRTASCIGEIACTLEAHERLGSSR